MKSNRFISSHLGETLEISQGCSHPIVIDKHDGYGKQVFGCGKCAYCRSKIRNAWNFRLNQEYTYNADVTFFSTLTYSDDYLSRYFLKSDCQKFIKRVRKSIQPLKMKYYFTSEYGSRTFRPHHHMISFLYGSITPDIYVQFFMTVNRQWKYGNVQTSYVSAPRINYITHYHTRPKFPVGVDPKQRKPFVLSSQRIGTFKLSDVVFRSGIPLVFNSFDGTWICLPPYYRKKYNIKLPDNRTRAAPPSLYLTDSDVLLLKNRDKKIDLLYNQETF